MLRYVIALLVSVMLIGCGQTDSGLSEGHEESSQEDTWKTQLANGKVMHKEPGVAVQSYQNILSWKRPTLILFTATWCGPCRALKASGKLEQAAKDLNGVGLVAVFDFDAFKDGSHKDESTGELTKGLDILQSLGVNSLPRPIFFHYGVPVKIGNPNGSLAQQFLEVSKLSAAKAEVASRKLVASGEIADKHVIEVAQAN